MTVVKIVVKRCWLDWAWVIATFIGWELSVRYAEQLLGGSSVAGFIADAILYTTCVVRGVIALDRTMFAIVYEPRQLTVTVTGSKLATKGSRVSYEYHFDGGVVRAPAISTDRAYPGDTVSFWYRPIDLIEGLKVTIYARAWGHAVTSG
ncbi:hypothetical protein IPM09_02915 [Candidatus Saccharibacteria bacterium]|nr:MAG: hypothetical protein IPM09_02915 [Candidatus Saccharibacteria bacterium]